MVGGDRGRVMGAIAVMGCIAGVGGTDGQPMLMGAMIMGPLAGFVIKKFDQAMDGRMPAGFEMLINNFRSVSSVWSWPSWAIMRSARL